MGIVKNILIAFYVVICLVIIIMVMMQAKPDGGLSGAITGSGSSGESNFYEKNKGRTKEGKLKKWTQILGAVFVVLTIALGILYVV